jgi:hypothetical protein
MMGDDHFNQSVSGESNMRAIPAKFFVSMAVIVVMLTLQSFGGDDKPPIEAKDLMASENNLKKIGKAIDQYLDDHKFMLPRNIPTKTKPTEKEELKKKLFLSWRVAILPYLGEKELYNQFKLDEDWDSENNKKLIEKIPAVYKPVRVKAKEGETFYQGFSGFKTVFDPRFELKFPATVPDGLENTGMVFEAAEPVIWSKPADIPFDMKKPVPKIGGQFDGESLVLLCDLSVIHLKKDPDDAEMKILIICSDGQGEPNWKKLKK